jgi:S1-C subfamily serine protease
MTPPETRPREPVRVRSRSPLAGATLVNISPAVADELQIEVSSEGIVVADVEEGSVAQRVGFQKGDLVLAINGQRIAATRDAERLIRTGAQYWELTINRSGRVFKTVLGG